MALIHTATNEEAEGHVKESYAMFMKNFGIIPKPMEMMSASPGLFELQMQRLRYYAGHAKLSFSLLAHIRYLVAHNLGYAFCSDFNKHLLKRQGLEEADIQAMEEDPANALLEDHETALLTFVIQAVREPKSITEAQITALKELGWEDGDLVDALAHGVSMIDHFIMMEVFQMDQHCMTTA